MDDAELQTDDSLADQGHARSARLAHVRGQSTAASIRDYVSIARPDHWFKNVFMLPGAFLGIVAQRPDDAWTVTLSFFTGLLATCLVCSSNYTINEWLDATEDRRHPEKRLRAAAAGKLWMPLVYLQWLLLAICAVALATLVSSMFALLTVILFLMGVVYNVPPLRTKNLPLADVLSEAVNNPIRLLLGWYSVQATAIPPLSLILAYWMVGAFFMGAKRLAEYRHIGADMAPGYRKSFAWYNEERLLVSLVFYATCFAFLGGVFLVRYRLELILLAPFIGIMMGTYLHVTYLPNSPVQHPERLYKSGPLMSVMLLCVMVFVLCFYIDMPWLRAAFESTLPGGFDP